MEEKKSNPFHSNNIKLKEFEIQFGLKIKTAKFSKTGKYLIFLNSEIVPGHFFLQETLIIYDIKNSREKSRISLKSGSIVKDYMCIDDSDNNYVLAVFSTSIHLWNIDTGASCGSLKLNAVGSLSVDIRDFIISSDSTYIGYLASDEINKLKNADFFRMFNIKEDKKIFEIKKDSLGNGIVISPNNKYVVIAGSSGLGTPDELKIFKFLGKDQLLHEKTLILKVIGKMRCVTFHPDGTRIFFIIHKTLYIYDFINHELDKMMSLDDHRNDSIEFNYDGSLLLTKCKNEFRLWDTENGQLFMDINRENNDPFKELYVVWASFSPVNNCLLLTFNNGTIRNINLDSNLADATFDIEEAKGQGNFIKCPKKIRAVKKEKAGCYIATAVYGSYDAKEVLILRGFRDNYLQNYPLGRVLVKTYYYISPILVHKFGKNKRILACTKKVLDKFVDTCKKHNNMIINK